jgi:hypothetical protein
VKPDGQPARLLSYLRAHPGATPMQLVTELRMPKYTARVSDLRAAGYTVAVSEDDEGTTHYRLVDTLPSGPGVAHISADDTPAQVDRKMAEALSPVAAILEAWDRVFGGET